MVEEIHTETSKSENSQDYAQKPQQNCMFINFLFQETIGRVRKRRIAEGEIGE
jgi:hypothetical protein